MERRKRRPTRRNFDKSQPENYIEEVEAARPDYDEKELLPVRGREEKRVIYYHECKVMECRVLKDNIEPCRFCGTEEWDVYNAYKRMEP
jgi:hypothetical protein